MVSEVVTGLQIFTQLFNTAKGLTDIHDAAVRDGAVLMIQKGVIDAQAAQMALVQEVGELKAQIARFETWDAEKQRYDLQEIDSGVLAYRIKPSMQGSEPDHYICPRCYEDRAKSILQAATRNPGRWAIHMCPRCKTEFAAHG